VIVVNNPKTGGRLAFPVKDAFITWLYAQNLSTGLVLEKIPPLEARCVRKLSIPTLASLKEMVQPELVSDAVLNKAIDSVEPITSYISTTTFHESMVRVHDGQLAHRWLYATQEHVLARAQAEQAMLSFYQNAPCRYSDDEVLYADWFQERGLDIPDFSPLEAGLLADEILKAATGANLKDVQSLKEMQAAMLRLMAQLSSYTVQFLQTINADPIRMVEWNAVRVGNDYLKMGDDINIELIDTRVLEVDAKARVFEKLPFQELGPNYSTTARMHHQDMLEIGLDHQTEAYNRVVEYYDIRPIDVLEIIEHTDNLETDTPDRQSEYYLPSGFVPLTDAFMSLNSPHYALSAADRQTIRDRWTEYTAGAGQPTNPIGRVLRNGLLDGFYYPNLTGLEVLTLPGFQYPNLADVQAGELDGFHYPPLAVLDDLILPGFSYPTLSEPFLLDVTGLSGLTYPTLDVPFTLAVTGLSGLTMPELMIDSPRLDGLDYP